MRYGDCKESHKDRKVRAGGNGAWEIPSIDRRKLAGWCRAPDGRCLLQMQTLPLGAGASSLRNNDDAARLTTSRLHFLPRKAFDLSYEAHGFVTISHAVKCGHRCNHPPSLSHHIDLHYPPTSIEPPTYSNGLHIGPAVATKGAVDDALSDPPPCGSTTKLHYSRRTRRRSPRGIGHRNTQSTERCGRRAGAIEGRGGSTRTSDRRQTESSRQRERAGERENHCLGGETSKRSEKVSTALPPMIRPCFGLESVANDPRDRTRGDFRNAQLQAKRNAEAARRKERELLFSRSQSAERRKQSSNEKLTQDDIVLNASNDVTDALRRTHQRMQAELSRSRFAQETLGMGSRFTAG